MNFAPNPTVLQILPDGAPFSAEQRAWLNGFFAGLLSLDSPATALSDAEAAALLPDLLAAPKEEAVTWHDPAIPFAERMKLAEGRALPLRLMAAMAQQDCGQCGSSCRDYSRAVYDQTEKRLNLCVPGGKETSRMLKTLCQEIGTPGAGVLAAPAALPALATTVPEPRRQAGHSRDDPAQAMLVKRTLLNKPGSAKETWHVEFDIAESGLDYGAGNRFGILPTNDPNLVAAVIRALDAPGDFPIGGRTLRAVLTDGVSLGPAPDMLFQLYSFLTGGERRAKAKALAAGEDPDGDAAFLDVLGGIEKFPKIQPDPEAFIEALDPLQPRLYSIASSPRVDPGRIALTVDAVRYSIAGRRRLGVASTFLADRLAPGDTVMAYVQKAEDFVLPADDAVPVIMVGPGTGIAPFRSFLHERMATKARGRNWLFFGHQRRDLDFFYEDELAGMKASGILTRLSLAWSRDDTEKFYVQDRMRQVGQDLWTWLADGAHIYVCGAMRMGQDVERAFIDIVARHGARSPDEAVAHIADLRKRGRYQTDTY